MTVAARLALEPLLGTRGPGILFALPIIVAARYGGTFPGFAATAATTLISWYYFCEPRYSLTIEKPADQVSLVLLLVVGVIISVVSGQLREVLLRGARQTEALQSVAREREEYLGELEAVRDSMSDGLFISDPGGNVSYVNPAALAAFGFGNAAEAQLTLPQYAATFELSTGDGTILPLERWPMTRALRGETLQQWEVTIRHRTLGWEKTFSHSGTLARDAAGKPLLAALTLTDVTERKRADEEVHRLNADLERRVHERTAQLGAVNKELQTFAYSVAHDLRSPLRGIDGWILALAEDYAPQLDAQAKLYIERVRIEAQRMGVLIDDLLRFSRITRVQLATQDVDLSALARTVAASLQEAHPERYLIFSIEPGVRSAGDSGLIEIVLTNLLSNAVKFTATRTPARIDFGEARVRGEAAFFVRDNGVGFEMAHAVKLFKPFQRLHKASEFPGSGIGLATAQRILQRHGGSIWAEAEPDHGANFYFTLGKNT